MTTPRAPDPPKQPSGTRSNRSSFFEDNPPPLQFTETNYRIVNDDNNVERLERVERSPEKLEDKLERAREKAENSGSTIRSRPPVSMTEGFLIRSNVFVNPSPRTPAEGTQSPSSPHPQQGRSQSPRPPLWRQYSHGSRRNSSFGSGVARPLSGAHQAAHQGHPPDPRHEK